MAIQVTKSVVLQTEAGDRIHLKEIKPGVARLFVEDPNHSDNPVEAGDFTAIDLRDLIALCRRALRDIEPERERKPRVTLAEKVEKARAKPRKPASMKAVPEQQTPTPPEGA